MNICWKGISILIILLVALYYNYLIIKNYLPGQSQVETFEIKAYFQDIETQYNKFKTINWVIGEPGKNRIRVIMSEGNKFPIDLPAIQNVLGKNNFELMEEKGKIYLKKLDDRNLDLFVSKVAINLRNLVSNLKKIKGISLDDETNSIIFQMAEKKRLPAVSEPIKSFIKDNLDWKYNSQSKNYSARLKKDQNLLNLGLDLKGGMYLDIGVHTKKVIALILEKDRLKIEELLTDENVNFEDVVISDYNEPELTGLKSIEVILDLDETFLFGGDGFDEFIQRYQVSKENQSYILTMTSEAHSQAIENAFNQVLEIIRNRIDSLGTKEASIQKRGNDSIIVQLPGEQDPARVIELIGKVGNLKFMLVANKGNMESPDIDQVVRYEEIRDPITKEIKKLEPYLLEKKVYLTGKMITDAGQRRDNNLGFYSVTMDFDSEGADIFAELTKNNLQRRLAIVLDNKVQSAPNINHAIYGGSAIITGRFTIREAQDLALVLKSGSLSVPIEFRELRTVGASLGEDSIRESMYALVLGFVFVIFFMFLYYKVAGLFSIFALLFNLVLILSFLAYFGATLTLPGMAGIILTIGMAVDANVLIFERIREEMNRGTGLRKAIITGFQRATITIFDANITTLIAAIVLIQTGTGPIKGFGLTLALGIGASMFTSIVVTRFLFELVYLRTRNIKNISI